MSTRSRSPLSAATAFVPGVLLFVITLVMGGRIPQISLYLRRGDVSYIWVYMIIALLGLGFFALATGKVKRKWLKVVLLVLSFVFIFALPLLMLGSHHYWKDSVRLILTPLIPFVLIALGYLRFTGHRWVNIVMGLLYLLAALWHLFLVICFVPILLSDRAFSSARTEDLVIAAVIFVVTAIFAIINYKGFRNSRVES